MITYYELLNDGTIGSSTTNKVVADLFGLKLMTDKQIVYGKDNKRYFKDNLPSSTKYQEYISEITTLKAMLADTDWISAKILDSYIRNDGTYEETRTKYLQDLYKRETYRARIHELQEKIYDLPITYFCYECEGKRYFIKNNTVQVYITVIDTIQNDATFIQNKSYKVVSITDDKVKLKNTLSDTEIIAIRNKDYDMH